MVYPAISAQAAPWKNTDELAVEMTIGGVSITGIPSRDAVTGDVPLGFGFEATAPYVLVSISDTDALGDLHGQTVVIGAFTYKVRNDRPKYDHDYRRLVLEKVS